MLGVFEGALVIHAPQFVPERRPSFERELQRVGIDRFEIVEAIAVDESIREQYGYHRPPNQNSIRALSLLLSMKSAIERAQDRGWHSVLLMQDDVIFRERFTKYWADVLEDVRTREWDMLFLYRWNREPIRESLTGTKLVPIKHTFCSHCVGIRAEAYETYKSVLKSTIAASGVEDTPATFHLLRERGMKIFATTRNLAGQGDFASALSSATSRASTADKFRIQVPNWRRTLDRVRIVFGPD